MQPNPENFLNFWGVVGASTGQGEYASAEWTEVEKRNGVATQIRSRNHIYSALRGRIDLTTRAHVQSLGIGIGRYQAPKTTRPMGQLPHIMFYVLILLKVNSTSLFQTHTHTGIHLSKQHGISSPNPSIHLSCNSCHHIQGSN